MASRQELDTGAKITDEMIEASRHRIGIETIRLDPGFEYASVDAFRRFAHGIGDDNPLWCDAAYGAKTRWKSAIGPPTWMYNTGVSVKKELTAEERERGRGGAMTGVHGFYSGDEILWFRHIHPGDRLTVRGCRTNVTTHKSRFSAMSVREDNGAVYWNQRGELVVIRKTWGFRHERDTGAKTGKYFDLQRHHYTPEEINKINADMDSNERRGANPRYWEDVKEGDQFQPLCLGVLLVTDMLSWSEGWGDSPFIGAHDIRRKYEKRHPRALTLNEFGVPDIVERVHWEDEFARKIGNPMAYDYGWQRNAWMCRAITEWMGDDAFIVKQWDRFTGFCYVGDATWVKGKVVKKYRDGHDCYADVEGHVEDQRGRIHADYHSTVLLPSRQYGAVQAPRPIAELEALREDQPLPLDAIQITVL